MDIKAIAIRAEDNPATKQDLSTNPVAVFLARLAPGSQPAMRGALRVMANMVEPGADYQTLAWWRLGYQHVAALRARLAERYAFTTVNLQLSALKGVLREAWRLGLMPGDQYRRAVDVAGLKGERLPAGRALAPEEIAALVGACMVEGTPVARLRDTAILALLFACGLRRSELVVLDVEHYRQADCMVQVIGGKGNKDREVPVLNGAKLALDAWLGARGTEPGPLFVAMVRGGRLTGRRLTAQSVRKMLCDRARQAGVEAFSPHDLRRTYITQLLEKNVDLLTVQKLAGHANPATTARYDRRDDKAKRQAVARLHFPYPGE